jgi:uncharacterized membrane protein YbhN (UPF0104 family)
VVLLAVDAQDALTRLMAADLGWMAAAAAALTMQTAVSALRWRLTARRLGMRLNFGHALSEYYLAQAANQILPGGVVGDVGRAVRASGTVGAGRAGASVVLERLAGQCGLGVLGLAMLGLSLAVPMGVAWTPWSAALAAGLGILPLALLAVPALMERLSVGRRLARMARRALLAPAVRLRQGGLSLASAGLNVAAFAFCARATGTEAALPALAAMAPLVLAAMLVPISVAGWGVREGAAAALWPMLGAVPAAGAAAGAAFGLAFLVASLGGVVIAVVRSFLTGTLPGRAQAGRC